MKEEFSIGICLIILLSVSDTTVQLTNDCATVADKSWDYIKKCLSMSKTYFHLKIVKENLLGNHLKKSKLLIFHIIIEQLRSI